jgi:predicted acetyltransferase
MQSFHDMIKVSPALASEHPVVARLMQLYQHDFSEFAQAGQSWGDVDDDGLFSYIYLDSYWVETGRKPFLFRADGKLAGFALINDWSYSERAVDWSMAEFFVMRKYRRCGIGRDAASQIIRSHRGVWEIGIAQYNLPAVPFWRNAVASLTSHNIEELAGDGKRWSGPILRLSPKERVG